jgi:hypothetical protein
MERRQGPQVAFIFRIFNDPDAIPEFTVDRLPMAQAWFRTIPNTLEFIVAEAEIHQNQPELDLLRWSRA